MESKALNRKLPWDFYTTRRSAFAAILVHTTENVSWVLFPNWGSHIGPASLMITTAVMAAAVTFLWGSRTLARFRYGRASPVTG